MVILSTQKAEVEIAGVERLSNQMKPLKWLFLFYRLLSSLCPICDYANPAESTSSPASAHVNHTIIDNDFQSNYWFLREMLSPQILPEVFAFLNLLNRD